MKVPEQDSEGTLIRDRVAQPCVDDLEKGLVETRGLISILEDGRRCLEDRLRTLSEDELRLLSVDYLNLNDFTVADMKLSRHGYEMTVTKRLPGGAKVKGKALLTLSASPSNALGRLVSEASHLVAWLLPLTNQAPADLPEHVWVVTARDYFHLCFAIFLHHFYDKYAYTLSGSERLRRAVAEYLETELSVDSDRLNMMLDNWSAAPETVD